MTILILLAAFEVGLDGYYYDDKRRFKVYTLNNPLEALSKFKPDFYDLLLTDVCMSAMNALNFVKNRA
jgi:hypothetical protein